MRCGIYMNNYFSLQKSTAICPEEAEHRNQNDNGVLVFLLLVPRMLCTYMCVCVCLSLLIAATIKYVFTFWNVVCVIARDWIFTYIKYSFEVCWKHPNQPNVCFFSSSSNCKLNEQKKNNKETEAQGTWNQIYVDLDSLFVELLEWI